jgi:hypothetical protein
LVALPERDVCACRMPQGRSRINDLRCSDLTTKAWTTSSTGSRVCPQWISVGSCSPKWNSYLLGFTKLVLTSQCLRFLTTGFAGEDLAQYLRRCLAHRHASNMTCSTELREREPYIGFVPFLSPRHPRSLALLYHGQRNQSSPGQVEAGEFWDDVWLLETAAEGEPELVWRYVEL